MRPLTFVGGPLLLSWWKWYFFRLGGPLLRYPTESPDRAGWAVFPERTSPSQLHLFLAYAGDRPAAIGSADPLFYFPLFCLCFLSAFVSLTLTKWLPAGDGSHEWDLVLGFDHLVVSVNGFMANRDLFSVGWEMTENPAFSLLVCVSVCLLRSNQEFCAHWEGEVIWTSESVSSWFRISWPVARIQAQLWCLCLYVHNTKRPLIIITWVREAFLCLEAINKLGRKVS